MTVRTAELLMAIAFAALSIAFMVKSTDGLQIGWVAGTGPGSGFWPFWLSTLMLLSCITIIVRWFLGVTPQSRSTEPFMDRRAAQLIGLIVTALFLLVLGLSYLGLYASLMLFLLFYLKLLGRHSWVLTIAMVVLTPIVLFFFFEWALIIPLPKGVTEPLFYPLYGLIY